jgi:hypothetical protein
MSRAGKTIRLKDNSSLRVFISYSHEDADFVGQLVKFLKTEVGVEPIYDRNIRIGMAFDAEIMRFIAHAHVFMPVLTPTADARKWVHQEIGYASALNIPILPLAVGKLPGEMIERLQAVRVCKDNIDALRNTLTLEHFERLVREKSGSAFALYQCASYPAERAAWLASISNEVTKLGELGFLRQKGGLSSLHIPKEVLSHPIWAERYAPHVRTPDHIHLQREERIALERHARGAGCRLIINPDLVFPDLATSALIVRLETLLRFLESMSDKDCEVAWNASMVHNESVTIVGNWFAAESVRARRGIGYYQTVFTRHAPTLVSKIAAFDDEFEGLLRLHGWLRRRSRREAMELISRKIAALEIAEQERPAREKEEGRGLK